MDKKCGCTKHSEYSEVFPNLAQTILRINGKQLKRSVIQELLRRGEIAGHTTYLCRGCSEFVITNLKTEGSAPKSSRPTYAEIEAVVAGLEAGKYPEIEVARLARALGDSQRRNVVIDAENLTASQKYYDLEGLDDSQWLAERNPVVVAFLRGVAGHHDNTRKASQAIRIASDCVYAATYTKTVTPLCFFINIINYFVSGSKTVCNANAALYPCGGYTTVRKWIETVTQNPNTCPSGADVVTFFDNNQGLGRSWRISEASKAPISVITSLIHIQPGPEWMLQNQPGLHPSRWLYNPTFPRPVICQRISSFIEETNALFGQLRDNYIAERLRVVFADQEVADNTIKDSVDPLLTDEHHPVKPGPTGEDPYSFVPHHVHQSPSITVGEPCFVNPCSYSAIETILRTLLQHKGQRHWTCVGSDGVPFLLSHHLIQQNPDLQGILLQPGLGHYEINMLKAFFKLMWDVCLVDLGTLLGFQSVKAQAACRAATDHHKAWQMFSVFLQGTADELLVPYVRFALRKQTPVHLAGFYQWLADVKDPNYIFTKDAVLTYALSLLLFRAGVRRNNSDVMLAARTKFSSLFYGLNMPKYQEIDFLDIKTRVLAPVEVREFFKANEAYSVSGHESKAEGGDFIMEANIRRTKMWLPPGLPSSQRWLRVCRNMDRLDDVKRALGPVIGDEVSDKPSFHTDLSREIQLWRRKIRAIGYFESPPTTRPHVSFGGLPLDKGLSAFAACCKGNRQLYLQDIASGSEPGKGVKLTPLFVLEHTRRQFLDVSSKTKAQIQGMVTADMARLRDLGFETTAEGLMHEWKKEVKCSTKAVYIDFWRKVRGSLQDAEDGAAECGEDDETEEM